MSGPQQSSRSRTPSGRLRHAWGFGAHDDGGRAPRITAHTAVTASRGGVAIGHAENVAITESVAGRDRRVRRLRMVIVPVVVVGGTITAIVLLPGLPDSSPGSSGPERTLPTPSLSASTSASPSPSPSGSPPATRSPSAPAAAGSSGSAKPVVQPVQTRTNPRSNTGSTPDAGTPPPAKSESAALSPGSVSTLRNASNDQCVYGTDGDVYPGFGTCSSSDAYTWTLRSTGGGTFELVNRASGKCLSAPFNNDYTTQLEACDAPGGTGYVKWSLGTSTSAGRLLKNTATGHCLEIAAPPFGGTKQVMVTTCNSTRREQLWK
ncbi:RICIN domain-containing protein [Streptomyces sp. NPDC050121]|uniref:RICIN domain-containing protein n=1 Tax=Streptomyces sp. NPDC050121 TaxID=3365601 RepID=UPI0037A70CB0